MVLKVSWVQFWVDAWVARSMIMIAQMGGSWVGLLVFWNIMYIIHMESVIKNIPKGLINDFHRI